MTSTVNAIYENGVFRPVEPVELPDNTPARVPMSEGLAKVYAILGERYNSGHTDTAARHNEHQP